MTYILNGHSCTFELGNGHRCKLGLRNGYSHRLEVENGCSYKLGLGQWLNYMYKKTSYLEGELIIIHVLLVIFLLKFVTSLKCIKSSLE